jgi:hypothetical protein
MLQLGTFGGLNRTVTVMSRFVIARGSRRRYP